MFNEGSGSLYLEWHKRRHLPTHEQFIMSSKSQWQTAHYLDFHSNLTEGNRYRAEVHSESRTYTKGTELVHLTLPRQQALSIAPLSCRVNHSQTQCFLLAILMIAWQVLSKPMNNPFDFKAETTVHSRPVFKDIIISPKVRMWRIRNTDKQKKH